MTWPRLLAAAVALAACTNGGVDSDTAPATDDTDPVDTDVPDVAAPTVSLGFPPSNTYTDAAVVRVRGAAEDDVALSSVEVNGVAADIAADGAWTVDVPLEPGDNRVQAVATDAAGNSAAAEIDIVRSWHLAEVRDVVWDGERGVAWALDRRQDAVIALDPDTGIARVLSDRSRGSGPALKSPLGFELDGDALLVVDDTLDAVIAVDIATGDRTEVTGPTRGTGVALTSPQDIATDGTAIHVIDGDRLAVLEIDRATGDRAVRSSADVGAGPLWARPVSIATRDGLAWVVDFDGDAIFEVDLETGDRRIVSSDTLGAGPQYATPNRIALTADGSGLLTDSTVEGVFVVDLDSGDRTLSTGTGHGSGPDLYWPRAAAERSDDELLVADSNLGAVVVADRTSGDRRLPDVTRVLDTETHRQPQHMILDGHVAWVVDSSRRALIRIDVATGEHAAVSDGVRGEGPALEEPVALVDHDGDWLVADEELGAVLSIDAASGDRTVVTGLGVGDGPALVGLEALVARGRIAWVLLSGIDAALFEVDLDDGTRRVVSAEGVGAGPALGAAAGLTLLGDEAIVSDGVGVGGQLIAVDLETGDRRVFSKLGEAGTGTPFADPTALVTTSAGDVLVCDSGLPGVVRVDASGNRRVVTDVGVGRGPQMRSPSGVGLHAATGHLIVADRAVAALFWVDVETGDRVMMPR